MVYNSRLQSVTEGSVCIHPKAGAWRKMHAVPHSIISEPGADLTVKELQQESQELLLVHSLHKLSYFCFHCLFKIIFNDCFYSLLLYYNYIIPSFSFLLPSFLLQFKIRCLWVVLQMLDLLSHINWQSR